MELAVLFVMLTMLWSGEHRGWNIPQWILFFSILAFIWFRIY